MRKKRLRIYRIYIVFLVLLLVVGLVASTLKGATGQSNLWTRQFGTEEEDTASAIEVDNQGNLYMVGATFGVLPGQVSLGNFDVYLRKYSSAGDELWTRQFGTHDLDEAFGVDVDSAGNVFVVGHSSSTRSTQATLGTRDAFVYKFDAEGNELWVRKFGTVESDGAFDVVADRIGNLYVVGDINGTIPGQTSNGKGDAFLRKYDGDGNEVWTRQFGSRERDEAYGVEVDGAGNVYVVGTTFDALPDQANLGWSDAYLRKYDSEGNDLWTHQFGTLRADEAFGVKIDGKGDLYVVGATHGTFSGQTESGIGDAYVRKYDNDGAKIWTRQFGTIGFERAWDVAISDSGNLYLVGMTGSALPGETYLGAGDAFVRGYDSKGNELWTLQFGSAEFEGARDVTTNGSGILYMVGGTEGALYGQTNLGESDAFLMALSDTATHTSSTSGSCYAPADGRGRADAFWAMSGLIALALVLARAVKVP